MERKLQEEEGAREKAVGRLTAMPRQQIEELILGCVCFVGCKWLFRFSKSCMVRMFACVLVLYYTRLVERPCRCDGFLKKK